MALAEGADAVPADRPGGAGMGSAGAARAEGSRVWVTPAAPAGNRPIGAGGDPADDAVTALRLVAAVLVGLGVPAWAITAAAAEAGARGDDADAASILIEAGALDAAAWGVALAATLGLDWRDRVDLIDDPDAGALDAARDRDPRQAWIRAGGARVLAIAPRGVTVARVAAALAAYPVLRARMVVVAAATLRAAMRARHAPAMTDAALTTLRRRRPWLSAAVAPSPPLVLALLLVFAALPFLVVLFGPGADLVLLLWFLPLTLLRLLAVIETGPRAPPPPLPAARLPRYAVLVPLYREAHMVPELVEALGRLDYPRDRLDLKLLVEADDGPTRAAAVAFAGVAGWDVVVVPPSRPRTKPKALAFALQLTDADLVTVFDAEDRPAPDQLRRAAAAFAAAPADVACVQAALDVEPRASGWSWLAGQFALEYRIQFHGFMPWLAGRAGWFLLGGTSNHFRRDALAAVGGWDPYNVTEDADIALRLARSGWRLEMLASATTEEAPVTRAVWMAQRSRWLKGWMQTWCVHMRRPGRLWRDLGPGGFVLFQLLLAGQVLSAFVYPASLLAVLALATGWRPLLQERSFLGDVALMTALVTLALAWATTALLAWRTAGPGRGRDRIVAIATLPAYWLLLYPAVIRAARELAAAPFRWNKTPHGLAAAGPAAVARATGAPPRGRRGAGGRARDQARS